MYRSFFGLSQLPFKITPDLTFFYRHASREDILNALVFSITRGDGIIKVIGEVGAGKTTMLRLVSERLPDQFTRIYISSPNLPPLDFLKLICSELNIPLPAKANKHEIVNLLQQFLLSQHTQGKQVVMLIDESQSMTIDTLEEIRLLGNLETETDKLLQIVMFGQPELDLTLEDTRIRPLKDRLVTEINLPAFDAEEVAKYLNYRMKVAGYKGRDVFDLKTAKVIKKITNGLPRAVNLLADKLLMAAFADSSYEIKAEHFAKANVASRSWSLSRNAWFYLGAAGVLLVFALFFVTVNLLLTQPEKIESVEVKVVPKVVVEKELVSPAKLASQVGISLETLMQLFTLQSRTEEFLNAEEYNPDFLIMDWTPISEFRQQYQTFQAGLKPKNMERIFVMIDTDLQQNTMRYRLFYDAQPRNQNHLVAIRRSLETVSSGFDFKPIKLQSIKEQFEQLKQTNKLL